MTTPDEVRAEQIVFPTHELATDIGAAIAGPLVEEEYNNVRSLIVEWVAIAIPIIRREAHDKWHRAGYEDGVRVERERCAKIAEDGCIGSTSLTESGNCNCISHVIANLIRDDRT